MKQKSAPYEQGSILRHVQYIQKGLQQRNQGELNLVTIFDRI